jgi:hypothetical protein
MRFCGVDLASVGKRAPNSIYGESSPQRYLSSHSQSYVVDFTQLWGHQGKLMKADEGSIAHTGSPVLMF